MLIDRPQIVEGSSIQNATVPSGTAFPSLPNVGELFYLTSGNTGLYSYNGSAWELSSSSAVLQAHMADDTRHLTPSQNTLLDGITVNFTDINSIPNVTSRVATLESKNTGDETQQTITDKLAGRLQLTSKWPAIHFNENDQPDSHGVYRIVVDGSWFRIDVDHSASRNFESTTDWINALSIDYDGLTKLQFLNVVPQYNATTGTAKSLVMAAQSSDVGAPGKVDLYAGSAGTDGSTNNVGGNINIIAGRGKWASTTTPVNASGGRVEIIGGIGGDNATSTAAAGGGVVLRGGASGSNSTGNGGHALVQGGVSSLGIGGDAYLWAGNGLTKGGYVGITSGYGTGPNASGGIVEIVAREGIGSGSGGDIKITSGASPSGTKGKVILTAPGGVTVNGLALSGTNTGDETRQSILDKFNAIIHLTGTQPTIIFNDQSITGGDTSRGAFRIIDRDDTLSFEANTAADRNFGSYNTPIKMSRNQVYIKSWLQIEGQFGIGDNSITMAGSKRVLRFTNGLDSQRWIVGVNDQADTGDNAGSNFIIERYNDGGGRIDTPVVIERNSGNIILNRPLMLETISTRQKLYNVVLTTQSVDTTANTVTFTTPHNLTNGMFLWYTTTGTTMRVNGQDTSRGRGFFVRVITPTSVKLYETYVAAEQDGISLVISAAGTGTETWRSALQAAEFIMDGAVTNTQKLAIQTYRYTGGNTWLSTSTRLQMKTDQTNQGYLEFNPPNNASGVNLGSSSESGYVQFSVLGSMQVLVAGPKNASNYVQIQGSTSGDDAKIYGTGGIDANVNLSLYGKGSGRVVSQSGFTFYRGQHQYAPTFAGAGGSNDLLSPSLEVAGVQRLVINGNTTITVKDWAPNNFYGRIILEIVNGGAYSVSMPGVRWALPTTGKPAASFAEYMAAIGRNPASFQVSGSDWIELWSVDAGVTVHGRLI